MESKHELDDLKGCRNYRGTLVTKLIGKGYSIWGVQCSTPQEVDEAIDRAGTILNESIVYPATVKNIDNGAMDATNVSNINDFGNG